MVTLIASIQGITRFANRHARKIFLIGVVAVAFHNWRLWQKDKELLESRKSAIQPLPPPEEWPATPLVSVLVAAWNEADMIQQHIESFLALRYPHKELILIAGGEDGTYELARAYAGSQVKVLQQIPGEGKQRALARGFDQCSGEIIFLTDADCRLDNDSFERTVWPIIVADEAAVTGGSQPLPEQISTSFIRMQAASQLYNTLVAPDYVEGLLGRNCAIRQKTLEEIRGLEAPAPTGTDYVLAKTLVHAGVAIRHVHESLVPTEFPSTPGGYVRQQRRWLRNVAFHGRRFGAINEVRAALASSLVGLLMLLVPWAAIFLGPVMLILWLLLLIHGLLSRWRYLGVASRWYTFSLRIRDFCMAVPTLFWDFVAWSSPLIDYLIPNRRGDW